LGETGAKAGPAPSAEDPVLQAVVGRLVHVYQPERIYLFGSAARGEAESGSDYDLMVIVPDTAPPELLDCGRGYRALRALGIPKDLLVSTKRDFDKQLHLKASFPSAIVREGRLLYRYPGTEKAPERAEAEAALARARGIVEAVLARLPDEVRP